MLPIFINVKLYLLINVGCSTIEVQYLDKPEKKKMSFTILTEKRYEDKVFTI